MKKPLKILITGQNSYIGGATERYLREFNLSCEQECYQVQQLSQRGEAWKSYDFSGYDTVLHMTGIAHVDLDKVTEEQKKQYFRINCDLAVETALKAKKEGVRQFIYMSSVIVFGDSAKVGNTKHITADTPAQPSNFYGSSKLKAEQKLEKLSDTNFQVALVRSPLVFGDGSKGNFPTLRKLAEKMPIFPTVANQRSMIYVENLAEFLRLLADSGEGGIFYPQNSDYISTCGMVHAIASAAGRKIVPCAALNPIVHMAAHMPGKIGKLVNKAFGSLTIDQTLSRRSFDGYCTYSLEESLQKIYQSR